MFLFDLRELRRDIYSKHGRLKINPEAALPVVMDVYRGPADPR